MGDSFLWVAEREREGFYQSETGSKGSEMELVLIKSVIILHQIRAKCGNCENDCC